MKKTLNEQIKRIHSLMKTTIKEQDDPRKADLVLPDTNDLFKTLETAIEGGGLRQQKYGSMVYQKAVESLQIALILLGYSLPKHGVDGLYGPETAAAVSRFASDHLGVKKTTSADPQILTKVSDVLKGKDVQPQEIAQFIDPEKIEKNEEFTDLDMSTGDGYNTYAQIAQRFIESKPPNPLGITGEMMAKSARRAFLMYHKFIPPELALSQLVIEGGIGDNTNLRNKPVRTKNPFNVGNYPGKSTVHETVQSGIDAYYKLIATRYLSGDKTVSDLFNDFVNQSNHRYAGSDYEYESKLSSIADEINGIAKSVVTPPQ